MVGMEDKEGVNRVELGRVGERPFWVLSLSILIRAVHQVGAAVFLTSFLIKDLGGSFTPYLVLTVVSGCLLFLPRECGIGRFTGRCQA